MRRKHSKSTGPKGLLDSRRWVIITIRNNGAQESQFPLPVTVNTQRIAFDRDEPVVAPAYYLDTIDNCILPKYEQVPESARTQGNSDEARLVEMKYSVDIEEIDSKYQTTEGIMEFIRLLRTDDCPEEYDHLKNRIRLGQVSFNRHNYEWSRENETKVKSKPVRKTSGAAADIN